MCVCVWQELTFLRLCYGCCWGIVFTMLCDSVIEGSGYESNRLSHALPLMVVRFNRVVRFNSVAKKGCPMSHQLFSDV